MAKSKSIKYIDWAKEDIDNSNTHWILPQLLCHIGNYWPIARGENGTYSFTQTLRTWKNTTLDLDGNPLNLDQVHGVIRYLTKAPRGEVLGALRQTSAEGLRYCAPVPLILSAWKQYRGVGYNLWDWSDSNRRFFLDSDLLSWSSHFYQPTPWSLPELIQFRVTALEVKSGARQGTVRKPESCSSVFGVSDPQFKALPRLMKLSLCQLWCFHPSLRTDLMITDHMNLDNTPPPLIQDEVVSKSVLITDSQIISPWDV